MSLRGDSMSGFLRCCRFNRLYQMHRVLLEWVSDKAERDYFKFVSAEFYPA